MTVSELMDQLRRLPPGAVVVVGGVGAEAVLLDEEDGVETVEIL